jgi:hypothetical protein
MREVLRIEDLIGITYNRLTILEEGLRHIEPNGKSQRVMICECSCGTIKNVFLKELRRGTTKSCGCISLETKVDIKKENTYGYLTVLSEVPPHIGSDGNKTRKVKVRCVCGTEKEIILNSLRQGNATSCGCMTERILSGKRTTKESPIPRIDLEKINNKNIGGWYAVEEISAKRNEKAEIVRIVKAQCKCGYTKEINLVKLLNSKQCRNCSIQDRRDLIPNEERILKKRLHSVYGAIKSRCRNPNDKSYKIYGEKGIKVESDFDTLPKFFKWMIDNGYTYNCKLEVDRKDCCGNYSVNNCRLVSKEENLLNMKAINLTLQDVSFIRSKDFDFETMKDNYGCKSNVIKRIMNYETFKTI